MANGSLAPSLLTFGVLGLAATCFMATSSLESASASAGPVETAAIVRQAAPVAETPAATPAAPAPAPAVIAAAPLTPAPALAETRPAISQSARAKTCQAEFMSTLKENPIDFPRDRYQLTPKAQAAADKLLVIARACSDLKIQVQAFTDNEGKKANNTRLSLRRAEAVREYLVAQGLSEDLLTAVGFGPDRPVASNRTASGRAKNRRIEFRVTRVES